MKWLLLLPLIFTLGCQKGELIAEESSLPLTLESMQIQDYDDEFAQAVLKGSVNLAVSEMEAMQFFIGPGCETPIGEVVRKDFDESGAEIQIYSNQMTPIYVIAGANACAFFMNYTPELPGLNPPAVTILSPASPTRASHSPGVYGLGFPNSANVHFYEDENCATEVGTGTVSDFETIGIQLELRPNYITPLHGKTIDPLGRESDCQFIENYRHWNLPAEPAELITSNPVSPHNLVRNPYIIGSTGEFVEEVALFSDPGCTDLLAEAESVEEFQDPGLQIHVDANSEKPVYAQTTDDLGNVSQCTYLMTYIHDDIPPGPPSYIEASPPTPTRLTIYPSIKGTSTPDSSHVHFYSDFLCLAAIGSGRRSDFESTGIRASVAENNITSIYAKNFDLAKNSSDCTYMLDYKHNTIPPPPPAFGGTNPPSPTNQSENPMVFGIPSPTTLYLRIYDDENCTNLVGNGLGEDFETPGIQANLQINTANQMYTQVEDLEGNIQDCTYLSAFDHSNLPAPDPAFLFSFPQSPTNASNMPFMIGTAPTSLTQVDFYDDALCTNSLGGGSRAQYVSSGIQVILPLDSTTNIYAKATDIYGNKSNCNLLTTFIHNTIPPEPPTYTATDPVSPNNDSYTPLITGDVLTHPASQLDPSKVVFYDSIGCISKLGEGTPDDFRAGGIVINVAQNAPTSVYAKAFDDAGNSTGCTYMTDYTYNALVPASPIFLAASPNTPSYSQDTLLTGTFGPSPDFMDRVSIGIYSDSSCSTELTSGSPTVFETTGIPVTMPNNAITSVYGLSVNEVGTLSNCVPLITFRHYDVPPQNLQANNNLDGSIYITWIPDIVSQPIPRYYLQRALKSGGPYTIVGADLSSNNFTDRNITDDTTYYYRIYATNSTGQSLYSSEVTAVVNAPPPEQALSLVATPSKGEVSLAWSGFSQNMSYIIYRSTQYGGPFERLDANPQFPNYTDEDVVNATTYYYYVTGTNPSGESISSNVASVTPLSLPPTPHDMVIRPVNSSPYCGGGRAVHVSWTAPEYFTNFSIYRSNVHSNETFYTSTSTNFFADCGVATNIFNFYRIKANWGSGQTTASNIKGFWDGTAPTFDVYPGDGEIFMQWTPSASQVNRFTLYRSTSREGPWTALLTESSASTYTDTAVSNGTAYFYYLQGHRTHVTGMIFGHWPTDITSAIPGPIPPAPSNLTLVTNASKSPVLSWTAPENYNRFKIYRAAAIGGPYTLIAYSDAATFTDSASVGMNFYRVAAQWGTSESAVSNTVSFRNGYSFSMSVTPTDDDIGLDWADVADAVDYRVFRSTDRYSGFSEIAISASSDYTDTSATTGVGYYYYTVARFADATEGQESAVGSGMRTDSKVPSGLTVSRITASSVDLTWATVTGADKYDIMQSVAMGGPYIKMATTVSAGFTLGGLNPQTEYYFQIISHFGVNTFPSAVFSATTLQIPTPPSFSVGNNLIDLSWSPVVGVTDYTLLRSTDLINYSPVVSNHPTSSYSDSSTVNGQLYSYKLQANYPEGTSVSDPTEGITPGITPLAPTGLSVRSDGSGTNLILSWGIVDGASRYNIYSSTSSGGPWTTPSSSAGATMDIAVSGLTIDTTYYFRVSSINGTLESALSETVSATTSLQPAAPTAQMNNASSVIVEWTAVAGANDYSIYRSVDGVTFDPIATGVVGVSYIDSTVDPNISYFYQYLPDDGQPMTMSARSQPVNIGTEPLVPQDPVAVSNDGSTIDIVWTKVPNVDEYEIHRGTASGGPYTLLTTVSAALSNYNDAAVSASNGYFYIIRSVNSSGVPSLFTSEVGVYLGNTPANLGAVNTPSAVDLSWDASAGAISYRVLRAIVTGGPYGEVGTTAATTYSDTTVEPNTDYFYVIEAVFADGSHSPQSNEASLTRDGTVDLQVAIELTDKSLSSSSASSISFERSQTTLDADAYDGTVQYYFEIVASNTDASDRLVDIIDSADGIVGSVNVTAGTSSPTRLRVAVTPNAGRDTYRLQLEQTTSDDQLTVHSARLLVDQTDATRTMLYFPLAILDSSATNSEDPLITTNSETYDALAQTIRFVKDTSNLSKLIDYNAWDIEVIVSADAGSAGTIVLQNETSGMSVPLSETYFDNTVPTLANIPLDEGMDEFGPDNEDDVYEVSLRCVFECASGQVSLYKAGIWVRLEKLTKGYTHFRTSAATQTSSTDISESHRLLLETANFSNPVTHFTATATDSGSTSVDVQLMTIGADTGTGGASAQAGSLLSFDSDGRSTQTSGPLSVSSGDRILTEVSPTGGTVDVESSAVLIYFSP